uniref:Small ribosomal subunit protein uS4c n=1 Tax=Chaetosphaeridium globosum TaxID=96477 RepID=RR4_CHAGL|nr:ribosomal protein S4 [Chaetosphaeridium globosum]Q8M9W2.1 RecName: Full=Small ribosomal subunit protein uS4c; AltName: Full=30S ribosomal protein S4, chloroplastic [Chaetosphaeridium globosum]AAM96577.1 ribosomal protein S4 [Chaetosphaeridium globosum]
MSRYRGPRIKIIRRLGILPGLTRKIPKKSMKLRSLSLQSKSKKKDSQYRIRLQEKQKLRYHYGLHERQLLKYVRIARKAKGSTGQVLLQLLEMRLDNTIFRLGMAPTIPAARQLVNHGHILVNGRIVNIPSYRCKPQDSITINTRTQTIALIQQNLGTTRKTKLPSHLMLRSTENSATVKQIVSRQSVGLKINELLVVEYYSRQA